VSDDTRQTSLAKKLERHADEEGQILEQYRTLADNLKRSAAGMLVNQILTEEEIHHLLLRTMAAWLEDSVRDQVKMVPAEADRAELVRLTRTLREHERETIDACRQLVSELGGEGEEFLGILLDAMALDSEKHDRLLDAVQKMLEQS
jgi:hypothetical protein